MDRQKSHITAAQLIIISNQGSYRDMHPEIFGHKKYAKYESPKYIFPNIITFIWYSQEQFVSSYSDKHVKRKTVIFFKIYSVQS